MKKFLQLACLLVLPLLLSNCEKQELKKPVRVNFAFDLNKAFNENSQLKITSGMIVLDNFNVSGTRDEGKDFSFERDFETPLELDLNGSGEIEELDYDVPQGNYKSLIVSFNTASDYNGNVLTLVGTYKVTSGPSRGIVLEVNSESLFKIEGEDVNSAADIVLDKGVNEKAEVELDPIYWFSQVPLSMLDNADVTTGGGQPTIIINQDTNSDIYSLVIDRITESNRAIFN